MQLFLPHHVHAAQIGPDIVFLDTVADAYFCLGDVSGRIELGVGGQIDVAAAETAEDLLEAGLICRARQGERKALPPAPTTSIRGGTMGVLSTRRILEVLAVTWSVQRRFARRPFCALLESRPGDPADVADPSAPLAEAVGQFERMRPWLPLSGQCLMRSYHLRAFLRARGFDALWVFGVRTWPFRAHCWLQVGDTVLDEDLERLVAYAPIMAA